MSSSYGENLHITIFGQSHSAAIGVTVDGIPAGERIDMDELCRFLARRAPGHGGWSTARTEADMPEFLSGIKNGVTCGAPVAAIIRNGDTRSQDYAALADTPRPGHADYTADIKYGGAQDKAGGGHFSGRLTAPLCIAGGICKQLLAHEGISIISRIASIAGIEDEGELTASTAGKAFPTVSEGRGELMQAAIAAARAEGDSVGGVVECAITGVPAGLGDPIFGGMENRIAAAVFGIPAVKGIEFGAGFAAAAMRGSTGARAARRIPCMRLTVSVAPVSSAPVLPAETTASPFPSLSIVSATAIDESFLRRVAVLGSSSMVITSLAFTTSISPQPSASRQALTLSSMPTSVTSTPSSLFALTAPFTISSGALSPPIASMIILTA